jgi:hypothetical protein
LATRGCCCQMVIRYLNRRWTVVNIFLVFRYSQWSRTVANQWGSVTLFNQWNLSKKSINWNLSFHFFSFSFLFILPSPISSLILFYFSVFFVIVSVNSLNVRRRLIIGILCLFFDDDDWDCNNPIYSLVNYLINCIYFNLGA